MIVGKAIDFKLIDSIIDEHGCSSQNVIAILQAIQEAYSYLPKEVFPHLAKR